MPERLTRYRVHGAMETRRRAPDKNENMVFIYRQLLDRTIFPKHKSLLLTKHGQALYSVGRDQLLFNHVGKARLYFLSSLKIDANVKTMLSLLVTYLPRQLRKALQFSISS